MTQPTTRITIAEIVASLGISRVKTFSCQNMSKSNNLAKESPEFIALEVVESESGKPYFEIEVPRNSSGTRSALVPGASHPPYKFEFDAPPAALRSELRRSLMT